MGVLLAVVVMTGMLVVVPAGLALIDVPGGVRRLWWAGAVPGAVSLWLAPGVWAAAAACAYLAVAVRLALHAVARLRTRRSTSPAEIAVLTALIGPAIAGVALVAERAGYPLWGFEPEILALTVAHFHFAGFAAALVAGLTCRAAGNGRMARAAALSVPIGTLAVLAGYFVADWAELAGAVVLTAGMWLVGLLTVRQVRRGVGDRVAGILLGVSAVVLVASMLLALTWAIGETTGLPKPSIGWMIASHGVLNAFGFALCAIAAWSRLRPARL